ncbi:hypothetical protein HOF92_14005 [bacterium]|nr:hypothetical protein [bacterium]
MGYTSRYLSTNHFMGKGYWIWVIPIDKGVVSFGIVYDKEVFKQEVDTQESFLQFLHNDPFTKLLLEGSTILDFQSHPHLSFRREKFCSPDCWAIIGDSFGFIDPFYSPGSDTIARQAYLLEHLVTTKDEKELQDLCDLMNSYTAFEYQILKLLYTDQYAGFESFEVFNIKSLWDFHSYTNRMVWNFYARKFADLDWLRREVEASDRSLELTRSLQKGFRDLYRYFKDAGLEKRHNQGHYSLRQNRFQIEEEMLLSYSDERSVDEHLYLCRLSVSELIEHRFEIPDFIDHKISQDLLTFASLSSFRLDQDWLDSFFLRVSRRFSLALRQRIGEKMKIEITAKDYLGRLPRCLEKKTVQIQTAALQIWTQKAYNPVFDQLIGKKERTFDGPSWKENS